jgi:hypothetical protein
MPGPTIEALLTPATVAVDAMTCGDPVSVLG